MGVIKQALVWSNPLTILMGIPLFVGFVFGVTAGEAVKKSKKYLKEMDL